MDNDENGGFRVVCCGGFRNYLFLVRISRFYNRGLEFKNFILLLR